MHFCSPSFRLSKAPKRSAIPASGNSEKHVALHLPLSLRVCTLVRPPFEHFILYPMMPQRRTQYPVLLRFALASRRNRGALTSAQSLPQRTMADSGDSTDDALRAITTQLEQLNASLASHEKVITERDKAQTIEMSSLSKRITEIVAEQTKSRHEGL
jgi:hypothetical protein